MYLCQTELIEIELFICIKMDLALNNKGLYAIKPKQTKQTNCNKKQLEWRLWIILVKISNNNDWWSFIYEINKI